MRHLLLFALVFGGCVTASTYAVYKHPTTGDVLECEKPAASGGIGVYGLADLPKVDRYNDCKDKVEALGYQRVGTTERAPTPRTSAEQSTPLPAK